MKIMMLTMPLVSLWISFTVPAGAGFYWAISYLFGILQIVITNKFWPADKIRAEAKAKMEAQSKMTREDRIKEARKKLPKNVRETIEALEEAGRQKKRRAAEKAMFIL